MPHNRKRGLPVSQVQVMNYLRSSHFLSVFLCQGAVERSTLTPKTFEAQPNQNVPATGHLAAYNEISAAYFTFVRLIQDEVVSSCCSSQ